MNAISVEASPIDKTALTVDYRFVRNGESCPTITSDVSFLAIVYAEVRCDANLQWAVSRQLVDAGCLVMMAVGHDCSSWDDTVDYANLEDFDYGNVPDEHFVMISWHENESFSEVCWLAKDSYAYEPYCESNQISHILIVHIGLCDQRENLLSDLNQA